TAAGARRAAGPRTARRGAVPFLRLRALPQHSWVPGQRAGGSGPDPAGKPARAGCGHIAAEQRVSLGLDRRCAAFQARFADALLHRIQRGGDPRTGCLPGGAAVSEADATVGKRSGPQPHPGPDPETNAREDAELRRVWQDPTGWRGASAVNHKQLARRYLYTAFAFFALGGVMALLMRLQLVVPENDL